MFTLSATQHIIGENVIVDSDKAETRTSWTALSDESVKENIIPVDKSVLNDIEKLVLKEWDRTDTERPGQSIRHEVGYVANDVQTVFPKATRFTGFEDKLEQKLLGLDYQCLASYGLKGIAELSIKVKALEAAIAVTKGE